MSVSVSDLSFSYNAESKIVLDTVSFSVGDGTLAAIVGPNGSGKSTLLKAISGYLCPRSGSIVIDGQNPRELRDAERAALVTYCGDEGEPAFDFTVIETVKLGRIARGVEEGSERASFEALTKVGLSDLAGRAITSLSSGERQRAFIARAMCQDPKVFLLDEPTAHLDMSYELLIMEMAKEMAAQEGKTILSVVHDLNLALRFASRILFLKGGQLLYDLTPEQVDVSVIEDVYGVTAHITRHPVLGYPVVLPTSRRP